MRRPAIAVKSPQGVPSAVVIDLTAGTAEGSSIGLDAIAQFERVMGTAHDDTLVGDSGNNLILGVGGDEAHGLAPVGAGTDSAR